ncbi:hypothetical protein Tco_0223947 [Tanacetum coccineum]
MLKKFGLEDSKPMKTPMSSDTKLTKDEECESVDSTKYRGMIGSLLYLTASRPDIMFSVCLCARFQEAPKTSHLEAVKRIFRYIKGTTHLGLWYPKGTGIETVVYANSDHAGDYMDRKSTSGICTFVGCCLTSWFSKKQIALAKSLTKAEYVSAVKACQQALWMKQALIDYAVRLDDVPIIFALQFLDVPCEGACVFTDRWRLDELAYGIPSDGPYQTNLPSIEDIILSIRIDRDGQVCRIRHEEEIDVLEYQVLTREIEPTLKPLEEIIRENVFCLGVIGIMFLHVFVICFIMSYTPKDSTLLISWENPKLENESYVLYDRVMNPLATQLERKTRRDRGTRRGRHSTSSSSAFDQPYSSHLNDDDDNGNDEGTSHASTPSPIPFLLLDITLSLSPITPLENLSSPPSPSPPPPQPPIIGRLPQYLSNVLDVFQNLKKYLADENLHVLVEEIKVDKTLRFVEEPVEIIDREVKSLKRSRVQIVKVHWNSKRGHEDFMKTKYPHLLVEQTIVGSTN